MDGVVGMDSKDRQIIRKLQRDGRMTNQALSERVNLSPSPCLRRVRNLDKAGVIRGYRADVDPKKYGLAVEAFIAVGLERHNKETVNHFESRIRDIDEVIACHLLTGAQDYLLHVVVADLDGYDDFIRNKLHQIGGIGSIDSSISYSTIKRTSVFPNID